MFKGIATVALLIISNAFMTLAWYGHIAFKSKLERFGMLAIVLLSWGIALYPQDGVTYEELYRKADKALYCAKRAGGGTYAFYRDEPAAS